MRSPEEVLETLAEKSAEITGSQVCAVLFKNRDGSTLVPTVGHNFDPESLASLSAPVSMENLLGRAIFTHQPCSRRDPGQLPAQARAVLARKGLRAVLAVPFAGDSEPDGVLLLATEKSRYGGDAGEAVRLIADIASACHERAKELSNVTSEMEELKSIAAISADIVLEQGHDEVILSLLKSSSGVLRADAAALYTLDPSGTHVICTGAYGLPAAALAPQGAEHHAVLCKVLEWTEPLVVSDTGNVPADCKFRLPVLDINSRSVLGLQLRRGGEPFGLLLALYRTPGAAEQVGAEICRLLAAEFTSAFHYSLALEESREHIRELTSANEQLSQQATQDGLTGLANHRTFQQRLTEHVHRVGRYGEMFSLAMIDVDHFKAYNDAYGHQEGDFALQKIAQIISKELRDSDFAARYGGEEFTLILPHTPKPQARVALERIRKAIDTYSFPNGKLTVSAGVAECPCDGVITSEVLEKADRALYHAKLTGRNRLCLWGTSEVLQPEAGSSDGRSISVLIVENDLDARQALEQFLHRAGYDMHRASSLQQAVDLLRTRKFDIMLSDTLVLGADGNELLGLATAIHPTMPIVLTAEPSMAGAAREAMRHGITDLLVTPFNETELPVVIERNIERKRLERQMLLEKSTGILLQAIDALVAAIDAKDHMTSGHTTRVTHICLAIADTLGMPSEERYTLELAARLHDIGKISLPDTALNKSGALSEDEWNAMMRHPAVGSQIVGAIGDLNYVSSIVRHHHERLDGKGYPDGLQGEAIPYLARIIAVADAFEAMTSERSFRRKMSGSEAISELRRCVSTHYSADIVEALVESLRSGSIECDNLRAA